MTQKDKIKEQIIEKADAIARSIANGKDVVITRSSGSSIKVKESSVKLI